MINYLAEISFKGDEVEINPTPSHNYSKQYNIYELDIRSQLGISYWLDWGGYYDNQALCFIIHVTYSLLNRKT